MEKTIDSNVELKIVIIIWIIITNIVITWGNIHEGENKNSVWDNGYTWDKYTKLINIHTLVLLFHLLCNTYIIIYKITKKYIYIYFAKIQNYYKDG